MRKPDLILFFSFALLLPICSFANEPVDNLFLKSSEDQLIMTKLNTEITKVANLIGACMQMKKSNAECLCQNKAAIGVLHDQFKSTLAKRPEWEKKTLNMKEKTGNTLIIDMPGLSQQLKLEPCQVSK